MGVIVIRVCESISKHTHSFIYLVFEKKNKKKNNRPIHVYLKTKVTLQLIFKRFTEFCWLNALLNFAEWNLKTVLMMLKNNHLCTWYTVVIISPFWQTDYQKGSIKTEGVKIKSYYSRTSMARTPLGPWKFVRDSGSSSLGRLLLVPHQEPLWR